MIMCTLYLFKMDRVSTDAGSIVSQVAQMLYEVPYNPDFSSYTLSSPLQDVMQEVRMLREQDRKLSQRLEELEKQVEVLSPKKRKPQP